MERRIEEARAHLAEARGVVILTGAGVSADSGVPTFRGEGGLWRSHRPEDLATPGAFARDPRLVWEWYGWRRERVAACAPNAAHEEIANFLDRRPDAVLVTQNVDGLHALAGPATADRILELHGSLFRTRCTVCADVRADRGETIDATSMSTLPRCEECGALLRPDIVWFGESLDPRIVGEAFTAAERAGASVVIGTSAVVQPAASVATRTLQCGGALIEVNPDATPLTRMATVSLPGRAADVVPALLGAA